MRFLKITMYVFLFVFFIVLNSYTESISRHKSKLYVDDKTEFRTHVYLYVYGDDDKPCIDGNYYVKVLDGDTLIVLSKTLKMRIRFKFVDTPESFTNTNKFTHDLKACKVSKKELIESGNQAKEMTLTLLKNSEYIKINILSKDPYDRYLSIIKFSLNGKEKNLNEYLVSHGFAVPFYRYIKHNSKIYEKYYKYEKEASSNNYGLWFNHRALMACYSDIDR